MDWFLYDIGLRHERVNAKSSTQVLFSYEEEDIRRFSNLH